MFTGIVTDVGTVSEARPLSEGVRLRIETAYDPATIPIGASISCAGVCLTVVALPEEGANGRWFEVEAWEEALRLTSAGSWEEGTRLNLERALKLGDELGGHIVSGHVDGIKELRVRESAQILNSRPCIMPTFPKLLSDVRWEHFVYQPSHASSRSRRFARG
jgi:riboflavin synthase